MKFNHLFFYRIVVALAVFVSCSVGTAYAGSKDLNVTAKLQGETQIDLFIKNITQDTYYQVTTTLSAGGYSVQKKGNVEANNGQIVQQFDGLEPKTTYTIIVRGEPIGVVLNQGFGPIKYTVRTDIDKPEFTEFPGIATGGTTTPVVTPTPTPTPYVPPKVVPSTKVMTEAEKAADKLGNGLVPCSDTCGFEDIFVLINNLITFLMTRVFLPIVVILFMYAGYKYLTAGGNPSKIANIKKMVLNIVVGMLLVLCSWLIVKVVISILVKDDDGALQFLQ